MRMETAGITLVQGDLRAIAKAIRLSRATMSNIRQNLFFAFVYNVIGVPIAAGALYPLIGFTFYGRKEASNKAKPFWGWHDNRTLKAKVLAEGQWALDPAYAV